LGKVIISICPYNIYHRCDRKHASGVTSSRCFSELHYDHISQLS